ncbi:CBF/Mak21 family-domain-containing protein [Phycomyces nitens]|nr:CBF/Mak21 family-domain-containing protein [Phycomyces nitens]
MAPPDQKDKYKKGNAAAGNKPQFSRRDGQNDRRGGPNDRRGGQNDRRSGPNDRRSGPNDRRSGPNDRRSGPNDRRGPNDRKSGNSDRRNGPSDRRGPNDRNNGQNDRRGGKFDNNKSDRGFKSGPPQKSNESGNPEEKAEAKPVRTAASEAEKKILHEQILALGGTKGDLKFLEDIDVDAEDILEDKEVKETMDSKVLNTLQHELKSFITNIGLTADLNVDLEDDEVEAEEDSEADEEEEDEEEEEEKPKHNKNAKLLIEPTPLWHQLALPPVNAKADRLTNTEMAEKYSYARELLLQENERGEKHSVLSSSDRNFMSNILTSGTLNDKVSALTLLIQESPLHGVKTLDAMMAMTKKKGRKEAVMAVQSLKDLFVGSVLPDRKLIYFNDRPLGAENVQDEHLLLWAFEDHLKKTYFEFVQQIELLAHDTLMHVRYSMIKCIQDLLSGKPEQEQNLLKLLVNKLGDSENKVAAKTAQMLTDLLIAHPGMKMYVVREIEQLLLRPNVSERAQYYAIITLNQTILTGKDTTVANKLIDLYFIFFRRLLKITEEEEKAEKANKKTAEEIQKEEDEKKKKNKNKQPEFELEDQQSKTIAAILTGVNRAFHFSNITEEVFEKHMEVLFKITHSGTFNTAIQALSLIFSISLAKHTATDRFYRTLYESMLDPRLITSSKQAMYLNLLFKAIRADSDNRRVKAFVKRMVQIAGHHQPPFICGLFYILSQLMSAQPGLHSMLTSPEDDDEEEHFVDMPDEDDEDADKDAQDKPETETETKEKTLDLSAQYDGRKRDPRFSNAEKSCLWELVPFQEHYHPSVARYAECLFKGEPIQDQPDLHHHTLMHFLDRFVYRNAKKQTTTKGSSIMQPLGSRRDGGVLFTRGGGVGLESVPLNSEAFWRKQVDQVPVDEVFFHKYFTQKAATDKPKTKPAEVDDEEDEVWRAMMSSIPGGLDDEDDDAADMEDSEDDEELQALMMGSEDDDDLMVSGAEDEELGSELDEDEELDDFELMNASSMDEEDQEVSEKRKAETDDEEEEEEEPEKKKKTKKPRLPTFASYEDYAKLIDSAE